MVLAELAGVPWFLSGPKKYFCSLAQLFETKYE